MALRGWQSRNAGASNTNHVTLSHNSHKCHWGQAGLLDGPMQIVKNCFEDEIILTMVVQIID